MYYGGFGTNIKAAKSVLAKSVLMSTVGVVLTAGFVGAFVHFCFGIGWLESLLVSSVLLLLTQRQCFIFSAPKS